MELFKTFGTDRPTPDAGMAVARVEGQDRLLSLVREPVVGEVIERNNSQEELLESVYRPVMDALQETVGKQDAQLGAITTPILERLGTLVSVQDAAYTQLTSALPAEVREELNTSRAGTLIADGPDPTMPRPGGEPDKSTVFSYDESRPDLVIPNTTPLVPFATPTTPTATPGAIGPPKSDEQEKPTTTTYGSGGTGEPMVEVIEPPRPVKPGEKEKCPPPCITVNVSCPPPKKSSGEPPEESDKEDEPPATKSVAVKADTVRRAPEGPPWDTASITLCNTAADYVARFSAVGEEVRKFMNAILSGSADMLAFVAKIKPFGVLGVAFDDAAKPLKVMENVLRQMAKMLTDYGTLFVGANGNALVGLYFTRGFITSMSHAEAGWNFLVTGKVNIDLVPTQTLKIVDYLIQYLHPVDVPGLPMVDTLYLNGEITLPEAECLSAMNGRQRMETRRQLRAERTKLSPDMEVKYWLQRRNPQQLLEQVLRGYGMTDVSEVSKLVELNKLLPPPSDAVRFSNRDVFDPQKLGLAEMRAEFNQQVGLKEMFEAIGLEKKSIRTKEGKNVELDLPFWYYIAAYEECSPTQGYEMQHRLRPNRVARYAMDDGRGGKVIPAPVDLSTIRTLLKEKDYNPIWRDRLAAISFRVPGRIDIRNMYRRGVFGPPRGLKGMNRANVNAPVPVGQAEVELRERYLDLGYNETDANACVLLDATEFDRLEGGKRKAQGMARICKAYKVGGFTYDQALAQLETITGNKDDAREFLGGCDLDLRIDDLRIAVAGVKKQFLLGVLNDQGAKNVLRQYGVAQPRVDTLLTTWNLYRTARQRELTAQQIATYWEEGLINLADARSRLVNLGYSPSDANVILNHVRVGAAAKGAKEAERVMRLRQAEARRLQSTVEREQKDRDRAEQMRLTRFLALQSEKNLKAWWQAGEITGEEIRAVLTSKGNNPVDVERWLRTNDPNRRSEADG